MSTESSRTTSSAEPGWCIGVDEVGRGPLAGPVAVGVFAVPKGGDLRVLAGIKDSKVLSARQREVWCRTLIALPGSRYAVSFVHASVIDRVGIVAAIRTALARALGKLSIDPVESSVLLDGGLYAPHSYARQETIIRGDASEPLIAGASIIAKVARDRVMVHADTRYPVYGFAAHKGYGTRAHVVALRRHGLSPLHRRTFCECLLRVTDLAR